MFGGHNRRCRLVTLTLIVVMVLNVVREFVFFGSSSSDVLCKRYNCYDHGSCLIGKCFCRPGYTGVDCEVIGNQSFIRECNRSNDDKCFIHPVYGVGEISIERWELARTNENDVWISFRQDNDRWEDHLIGFDYYRMLPSGLGDMVEVGCGPFTQVLSILRLKTKQINLRSLTLWDPNAKEYMKRVPHCSYKNGTLKGFNRIPTTIIARPSEEMHSYDHKFDTILIINVLDHVQNAFQILQNIYNCLRPNGILIFSERWWDQTFTDPAYQTDVLHPIRIKFYVWKWFTDHFHPLYDARNHPSFLKYNQNGSYFIGIKIEPR